MSQLAPTVMTCLIGLMLVLTLVGCSAFAPKRRTGSQPLTSTTLNVTPSVPPTIKGLRQEQIDLPTGASMQVLSMLPSTSRLQRDKKPVLLFLHGSFHAAWCWSEHFFEYFAKLGYTVVAPSWRGTGGTFAGDGVKKVKMSEHVADLEALLDRLPELTGSASKEPVRPVLISHSFGGLAVMKMLEKVPDRASQLSGIVTMCSVPPSGNGKLTLRYLQRSLKDSWKITAGFAMKQCVKDSGLCRDLFFGGPTYTRPDGNMEDYGVPDADLMRYQQYFARDSQATIDLFNLVKQLPSFKAIEGRAPFVDRLPPCMVVGATDDFIVDREGVEETAKYFGVTPTFVDSPHDVMLGSRWKNTADTISKWLESK
jgi:pimeloyl-ACP methyl ester carboxylesterase